MVIYNTINIVILTLSKELPSQQGKYKRSILNIKYITINEVLYDLPLTVFWYHYY